MQILKFLGTARCSSSYLNCETCLPIIFQVFFSAYANECVGDYEPDWFAFNFAENGYGKFKAALDEENDICEALSHASSDKFALCM